MFARISQTCEASDRTDRVYRFNLPEVLSVWKEKPEIDERDFLPLATLMRIEFYERVRAHAYIKWEYNYMFIFLLITELLSYRHINRYNKIYTKHI